MNVVEIFAHVKDSRSIHFPLGYHWDLPVVFGLQLTKFMVLELVAALLMLAIFIPLGRRMARGGAPRGLVWNMFEAMLVFVRDEVARPAIGHDADRFLPFLWNIFFFVLFCNLLGILPWAGSPTGALGVTAALALITFVAVVGSGIAKYGPIGFWLGMKPHMEVPWVMGIFLTPMILGIEILGLFIKHAVLAVRLLANMFAGHLVLAVLTAFIAATAGTMVLWVGVTFATVLSAVALNLLELLVALLAGVYFRFFGSPVYRHGSPPALIGH